MTVNNSENNKEIKKVDVYREFIIWSALPPSERGKSGIETQEQFSKHYGIGINTPTLWKQRAGFREQVNRLRDGWVFGKTSDVIESVYNSAVGGNAQSQKMWLEHFEAESKEGSKKIPDAPVMHPDDIIFIVQCMPEPYKTKHMNFLFEFLNDAQKLRYSGQLDDKEVDEVLEVNKSQQIAEEQIIAKLNRLLDIRLSRDNISLNEVKMFDEKESTLRVELQNLKEVRSSKSNTDWIEEVSNKFSLIAEILETLTGGDRTERKDILMDFGSNLILSEGKVSIYNVKEVEMFVDCLKQAKIDNPEF